MNNWKTGCVDRWMDRIVSQTRGFEDCQRMKEWLYLSLPITQMDLWDDLQDLSRSLRRQGLHRKSKGQSSGIMQACGARLCVSSYTWGWPSSWRQVFSSLCQSSAPGSTGLKGSSQEHFRFWESLAQLSPLVLRSIHWWGVSQVDVSGSWW